jgi:hypothetical protein
MFEWLNSEGASLKHHTPGETNYVTRIKDRGNNPEAAATRPFPNNPLFISESILSEELRNEIYNRVIGQKKSLRAVSVELGIDMKRIAAVVRLVELEVRQRQQVRTRISLTIFYIESLWTLLPLHANDESQKID